MTGTGTIRLLALFSIVTLTGCAAIPATGDGPVTIDSYVHIVSIDGIEPDFPFHVELSPEAHEMVVEYRTFLVNYRCEFQFEAKAGVHYEIVVHSNPQPVVLYEMQKLNWFLTNRINPILPA